MSIIKIETRPAGAADWLRRRRMKAIFSAYWIMTITVGTLLPTGHQPYFLRRFSHAVVSQLDGVMHVASHSFDPGFVELFISFTIAIAAALAIFSCFWIPAGSERTYGNIRSKAIFLVLGMGLLGMALGVVELKNSIHGVSGGATSALLSLGCSTKLGALTILNVWFGFGQLFLFIAIRAGATSPIEQAI